jgi:hypothetical protein
MATPDIIKSLSYSKDGSPWCRVTAKSGIVTDSLALSNDGSPWWGLLISGGGSSPTWKLYVGSIQASAIYIGAVEASQMYIGTSALKT